MKYNTYMLPALPLDQWEPSRLHLQLICQIVGKIRLRMHPPENHWWHASLYLSARGFSTRAIPFDGGEFEIEIDILDRQLVIRTSAGEARTITLDCSVAELYRVSMSALHDLGIPAKILAKPYECKSTVPFARDEEHVDYDREAITRAWRVLTAIEPVFKEFRGRFIGKCSPVHMFWHSFDLACTRFSGKRAPAFEADKTTMEAYSHEVNSCGFWFGDDTVPEPAFYCYHAPLPSGLADSRLDPPTAYWQELRGSPTAIYRYEDFRASSDPKGSLLSFLQSSYEAGANLAGWDRRELERG